MKFNPLASGLSVTSQQIPAFIHPGNSAEYLYLLGGVHGDEKEGVYVLKHLLQWLQEDGQNFNLSLVVVPALNVDGLSRNSRTNANGVDLNRNLPTDNWSGEYSESKYNPGPRPLSEPENQFLTELFKKYPPYFCISFHSWKPILNYNGNCQDVAEFLSQYNGYPVSPSIGYPTPGSLGDYLPEKYTSPVITFECPPVDENISLEKIWQENAEGLRLLFKSKLLTSQHIRRKS